MNPIWNRTLSLLAITALAALLLYALGGMVIALIFFTVAILILYLRDKRYLHQLWRWVESGQITRLPPAGGAWEQLFAMLYKHQRTEHQQHKTLTEALISFQRAAQALPEGVITLNDENQIIWFNAQARDHYGLFFPQDTGQNIANLLRSPDFLAYLAQEEWSTPITIRVRDARNDMERLPDRSLDRVLSIQLVGYGDLQKLLLSRDVTKFEKLETIRRDFVANVSHELKTPLTVLSGFLETIQELKLPPKQQEHYLKLMSEQSERMRHLVTDLLTLSALESNTHPVDENVDMKTLLTRLEETASQLSAGQHVLTFNVEAGLDLLGAEGELTSAFTNLVTNAIRYTPEGGRVTATWQSYVTEDEEHHASGIGARLIVSDSGIGIPAQHLPRLTERFYRVDRGRSRESGGTGLGLAIVKHVLTRHQGHLEIESIIGVGSTFTAILPPRRVVRAETLKEVYGQALAPPFEPLLGSPISLPGDHSDSADAADLCNSAVGRALRQRERLSET